MTPGDRWRVPHVLVYTDLDTHARDVVERYYAAFDAHRDEWQDLVTDDVVFDGPVQHARGKAEFVDLTRQFLSAHRATRLLQRVADESTVISMFEFAIDAPNGQRLTCPVVSGRQQRRTDQRVSRLLRSTRVRTRIRNG